MYSSANMHQLNVVQEKNLPVDIVCVIYIVGWKMSVSGMFAVFRQWREAINYSFSLE